MITNFILIFFSFQSYEFNETVEISSYFTAFCECFARLHLHSEITLSYIHKSRECTINISYDILPLLNMKDWICFRYLSYDDPVIELTDFRGQFIRIHWLGWRHLEPNRAEVMVPAVVDVCCRRPSESSFNVFQSLSLINSWSLALAVEFPGNLSLTFHFVKAIEETEPLNQGIVASE